MKNYTKQFILIFALLTAIACQARADLAGKIIGIINKPELAKIKFSVQIMSADTGKIVYTHNAETPLVPASNMKIVVSAAALKYLGPKFEYKTRVALSGNKLAVIGSGDPLLGDKKTDEKYSRPEGWIFNDIVRKVKERGVTSLNDILVDTTVFDDQRAHPSWPADQLNTWYACEVSGINYNSNCIDIKVENREGKIAITIEPQTSFVKIINEVSAVQSGTEAVGAYRNSQPNEIFIRGKCKTKQGPFSVAIERPAAFFGFILFEHLNQAGITVGGKLIEKSIDDVGNLDIIAEYSTSLEDCLARCNQDSFGLAAESMLKTIAAKENGFKDGSWQGGQVILSNYLTGLDIPQDQFNIDDASGLSREDRLSANAITKVLRSVYKGKNSKIYLESLAAGGTKGTIAKYFKEPKYKGKILGKTGYISGVKSFSGVCLTKNGDYIFSIITNNNNSSREALNEIAEAIIDTYDVAQ